MVGLSVCGCLSLGLVYLFVSGEGVKQTNKKRDCGEKIGSYFSMYEHRNGTDKEQICSLSALAV